MRTIVTKEYIEKRILDVGYNVRFGTTITMCFITMVNGYTVVGTSACVNAANFEAAVGRRLAYEDAFKQLWPLEGYLLAEQITPKGPKWVQEILKGESYGQEETS